jgi:hypothetical protein
MYTNKVVNSVMLQLYLPHDFYNIVCKIKRILYVTLRVSPPPHPNEKFVVHTCVSRVLTHSAIKSCFFQSCSIKNVLSIVLAILHLLILHYQKCSVIIAITGQNVGPLPYALCISKSDYMYSEVCIMP